MAVSRMSVPASDFLQRRRYARALTVLLGALSVSGAPVARATESGAPAAAHDTSTHGQAASSADATATTAGDPATATPARFQLQVLAPQVIVRESPRVDADPLAGIPRGQTLLADREEGGWYHVVIAGAVRRDGWVHQEPGQYGDTVLSVQAVAEGTRMPFADDTADTIARRPAMPLLPSAYGLPPVDSRHVPPPEAALPRESVSVPDRWRIMQALGFRFPFYDPYHQNVLKGDVPAFGDDWFTALGLISDTTLEWRNLPTPVAPQTSGSPGSLDVLGKGKQSAFVENVVLNLSLVKGDTTFKPPEYEFRFVPVFNFNQARVEEERVLRVDPRQGTTRTDNFVGVQELFVDTHLRNVSPRYDFDSLRVGIQPLNLDFRGFLFQDNALAVRFFGIRDSNRWQYNIGWARRLEKDTNSGLNDIHQDARDDSLIFFNLYRQDFLVPGFTGEFVVVHDDNREAGPDYYDSNGFQVRPAVMGDARPHDYRVEYFGLNGDGHFGRYGLSASTYLAIGRDTHSPLAQRPVDIRAGFAAAEISRDFDWIRVRGNALYASGDKNPFDGVATGFDAILENPQFAGSDTSFFIRQAVPLIGGGGVALSGRNGLLPDLRSSKDQGQSNFVNPGLTLVGVGADADLLPTLRVLGNVSLLRFNDTQVLGVLRNQQPPSDDLGTDVSVGLQYRPLYSQNVVITGSVATLLPGRGLRELYGTDNSPPLYSALFNVILAY